MATTIDLKKDALVPLPGDDAPYMVNIFRVDEHDTNAEIEAAVAQAMVNQAETAPSDAPAIDLTSPDRQASQGQARSRARLMAVILLFGMGAALLMFSLQGRETMADRIEDIVPLPATTKSRAIPDTPSSPVLASLPSLQDAEAVMDAQTALASAPL